MLYMPQTDEQKAFEFLESLRKKIEGTVVEFEDQKISVTVTVGMCTGSSLTEYEAVIKQADDRLYYGKPYCCMKNSLQTCRRIKNVH